MDEAYEPDLANEGSHPALVTKASAQQALERLAQGNARYRTARSNTGDISADLIRELADRGQAPFACVVACADSRVVPEHIFMAGLGELFCIRVAGNVIGESQMASCIYAAEHLGVKLVLVLGHTHCGAIESAMEPGDANELSALLEPIRHAIGDERDPRAASELNARAAAAALSRSPVIARLSEAEGLQVRSAVYHTHTGEVEFLQ